MPACTERALFMNRWGAQQISGLVSRKEQKAKVSVVGGLSRIHRDLEPVVRELGT